MTLETRNPTFVIDRTPPTVVQPLPATKSSRLRNGFSFVASTLYETPAEAAVFAVGAVAMKIFIPRLVIPLIGISFSLILSRLAIKIIDRYDISLLLTLKMKVCSIKETYPKLQLVAFITTLAVSVLFPNVGFVLGTLVGAYGAIVLDVENFVLMQKSTRT